VPALPRQFPPGIAAEYSKIQGKTYSTEGLGTVISRATDAANVGALGTILLTVSASIGIGRRYHTDMDIVDIQHAIEALPLEQQAALLNWLAERDRLQWDREIERDFSPGGRGAKLLEHVKAQVRDGKSIPMAESRRPR
jgi:hypothetical protein